MSGKSSELSIESGIRAVMIRNGDLKRGEVRLRLHTSMLF